MARGDAAIISRQMATAEKSTDRHRARSNSAEWKRGDSIVMVKNPEYYLKGLPYLDKVIFKFIPDPSSQLAALKAGDVDVIAYDLAPENAARLGKEISGSRCSKATPPRMSSWP